MHPVILALTAAAEGQRPDDTLTGDARDWLRIALGAQYDDDGTLRGPAWFAETTRSAARRLLPYAHAALGVGEPVIGERDALETLADAPLSADVACILCALGLAEMDEDGVVVSDEARERWCAALDALEGA